MKGQGRPDLVRAGKGRSALVKRGKGRGDPVREGRGGSGPGDPMDYNVLLVVLDDIGTEWFDWMGVGRRLYNDPTDPGAIFTYAKTPFLSSLAAGGLWFSDFNGALSCGPTRSMLHTGRYQFRTGFTKNIRDPHIAFSASTTPIHYRLPDSELALCEHLRTHRPDYAFGAFGKWDLADGWDYQTSQSPPTVSEPPNDNLDHYTAMGFDFQDGNINNIGGLSRWWRIKNGAVDQYYDGTTPDESQYNTAIIAQSATDWIAAQGANPWMAYLCFGAPHEPFNVPPFSMLSADTQAKISIMFNEGDSLPQSSTYKTPGMRQLWSAMMEATDEGIRRVVEGMDPVVRGRTMIVVIGDNGTVPAAIPTGLVNGKGSNFWGGTRIPAIISGPLVAHPGRSSGAMVHAVDLYPTFCDMLRAPYPTGITMDGTSLMPIIQSRVQDTKNVLHDYLYFHREFIGQQFWAAYDGRYRGGVLFGATGDVTDELLDPIERTNYRTTQEAKYQELRAWKNSIGSPALPA